jgi:hypothetical protein
MVVDGKSEFVGSDARSADRAFVQALMEPKIQVRLSSVSLEDTRNLKAHVETEVVPASFGPDRSDVYLAIALGHAQSNVAGGENSGRILSHAGVARSLVKIGTLRPGQSFAKDVQLRLEAGRNPENVRLIAFIQEPAAGKVIGATMQLLTK